MTIVMMRANATREHADKIGTAAEAMFAAIENERPQGVRYSAYRVGDTEVFVILLELQEGTENPLPGITAVRTFQEDLRGRMARRAARDGTTHSGRPVPVLLTSGDPTGLKGAPDHQRPHSPHGRTAPRGIIEGNVGPRRWHHPLQGRAAGKPALTTRHDLFDRGWSGDPPSASSRGQDRRSSQSR
jgi:hypothetical protein